MILPMELFLLFSVNQIHDRNNKNVYNTCLHVVPRSKIKQLKKSMIQISLPLVNQQYDQNDVHKHGQTLDINVIVIFYMSIENSLEMVFQLV